MSQKICRDLFWPYINKLEALRQAHKHTTIEELRPYARKMIYIEMAIEWIRFKQKYGLVLEAKNE